MNIEYVQTFSSPSSHNLLVSFSEPTKNVLRTFIGTFTAFGERVEMNKEWLYEVPVNPPVPMCIIGSLVKHKETEEWSIFVDEWYDNGDDDFYLFNSESPYKLFNHVFTFDLPQGKKDLSDITVRVLAIVPPHKDSSDASSPQSEG